MENKEKMKSEDENKVDHIYHIFSLFSEKIKDYYEKSNKSLELTKIFFGIDDE